MTLQAFLEERVNTYAQRIIDRGETTDEVAMGELIFYMAMRRVAAGKGTMQDLGMMDAISDTLQQMGHLPDNVVFYK